MSTDTPPEPAKPTTTAERPSDALARRIGGVFLALFGVAAIQIAGVLVMQQGGLDLSDMIDLGWISRAGGTSQFTRWGPAHLGFPFGLLMMVTGAVYIFRPRRT